MPFVCRCLAVPTKASRCFATKSSIVVSNRPLISATKMRGGARDEGSTLRVGIAHYARDISSNLLYRGGQFLITAARDEDVRAFVHTLLHGRKANTAVATSNECSLSFQFL